MALTRIKTDQITDLSITTPKIADDAVTIDKLLIDDDYGTITESAEATDDYGSIEL
jgi:hypothetical protein